MEPLPKNPIHIAIDQSPQQNHKGELSNSEASKIAEGIRQAEAGEFAGEQEVKALFKQWGVDAKD